MTAKLTQWTGIVMIVACLTGCRAPSRLHLEKMIIRDVRQQTVEKADSFLKLRPVTVTDFRCERSAGDLMIFILKGTTGGLTPKILTGLISSGMAKAIPVIFRITGMP